MTNIPPRIALFLRYFGGGGADLAMAYLAQGFLDKGLKVDFLLSQSGGPHIWKIPAEARIVDLGGFGNFATLKGLSRYLKQEQPEALLSALHFNNEIAVVAKSWANVSTRIVVCEQNTLSKRANNETQFLKRITPFLAKITYPWADNVIAVSRGVAQDLRQITGLPLEKFEVIYNPAVTTTLFEKSQEPLDHPWFAPGEPPVILGVGKLEAQKDFPTLIHAFAKVRKTQHARLVILGWGPDRNREELEALAQELGVDEDVSLLGYVNNPYAYMARSAVFALSSRWEGLPFVLVEAMALGIPVVSTDCESGPAEVLDHGRYGQLVPVGNSQTLGDAISNVLVQPPEPVDKEWLTQFTLEAITEQYYNVLLPSFSKSR
jgi:glycosyltransferase involved in cell wall biosynthesis